MKNLFSVLLSATFLSSSAFAGPVMSGTNNPSANTAGANAANSGANSATKPDSCGGLFYYKTGNYSDALDKGTKDLKAGKTDGSQAMAKAYSAYQSACLPLAKYYPEFGSSGKQMMEDLKTRYTQLRDGLNQVVGKEKNICTQHAAALAGVNAQTAAQANNANMNARQAQSGAGSLASNAQSTFTGLQSRADDVGDYIKKNVYKSQSAQTNKGEDVTLKGNTSNLISGVIDPGTKWIHQQMATKGVDRGKAISQENQKVVKFADQAAVDAASTNIINCRGAMEQLNNANEAGQKMAKDLSLAQASHKYYSVYFSTEQVRAQSAAAALNMNASNTGSMNGSNITGGPQTGFGPTQIPPNVNTTRLTPQTGFGPTKIPSGDPTPAGSH